MKKLVAEQPQDLKAIHMSFFCGNCVKHSISGYTVNLSDSAIDLIMDIVNEHADDTGENKVISKRVHAALTARFNEHPLKQGTLTTFKLSDVPNIQPKEDYIDYNDYVVLWVVDA